MKLYLKRAIGIFTARHYHGSFKTQRAYHGSLSTGVLVNSLKFCHKSAVETAVKFKAYDWLNETALFSHPVGRTNQLVASRPIWTSSLHGANENSRHGYVRDNLLVFGPGIVGFQLTMLIAL